MSRKNDIILKYFILPLYKIPYKTVEHYYLGAYLNKEGTFLFLETSENVDFLSNPYWKGVSNIVNNRQFYIFVTPDEFQNDIKFIMESSYSKVSEEGKRRIVELCGLSYKEKTPQGLFTSYPLMALFKFPEWRDFIERDYGVKLDNSDELLEGVTKELFIEHLIEGV